MAKPSIQNINTTQTFQNWLDKTNEMVNIFKTDAITASGGGDTTNGNATLAGTFTATNLVADTLLQTDVIAPQTGGSTIQVNGQTQFNGTSQVAAIFSHGSGGQAQFTNGSIGWIAGLDSTNFIIDQGPSPTKFSLSTAGTLTVPNLIALEDISATGDISATNFIGDGSQLTGVISAVAIDDISDVTITNVQNGQVLKYNSSQNKWVNDTDFDGGSNVNAATLDGLDSTQFLRSDTSDTFAGTLTVNGAINQTGNLTVTGEIRATGNITTDYGASDIALKENLEVIDNALDRVSQLSGYTFNYIDKPGETVPGVIAQEVEKVLPGVVYDHERNGGTYKAVRYEQLIPLLIESIKELKEKVNILEDQVNS